LQDWFNRICFGSRPWLNGPTGTIRVDVVVVKKGLECMACGNEQTTPFPFPGDLKQLYETYYNFGGEKGTFYTGLWARLFASTDYTDPPAIARHERAGLRRL